MYLRSLAEMDALNAQENNAVKGIQIIDKDGITIQARTLVEGSGMKKIKKNYLKLIDNLEIDGKAFQNSLSVDNAIKNHFYSTLRKSLRRINKLHGEKNSTLKMRLIKPHVLSEILSDIHLTEMIFTLGRHKPSKHHSLSLYQDSIIFQGVFDKLIKINAEYERKKKLKSQYKKKKFGKISQNTLIQQSTIQTINEKQQKKNIMTSLKKRINSSTRFFKIKTIPKRIKKKKNTVIQQNQNQKQQQRTNKSKRIRKVINYYSLHQGLEPCQAQLKQKIINDQKSKLFSENRQLFYCDNQSKVILKQQQNQKNIEQQEPRLSSLSQILQQEQHVEENFRLIDKSCIQFQGIMNGFDNQESKQYFCGFDLKYPSPCFAKRTDDLTISDTHLKIINTPHYFKHHLTPGFDNFDQRPPLEQQISEQVKIDFDLNFALQDAEQQ